MNVFPTSVYPGPLSRVRACRLQVKADPCDTAINSGGSRLPTSPATDVTRCDSCDKGFVFCRASLISERHLCPTPMISCDFYVSTVHTERDVASTGTCDGTSCVECDPDPSGVDIPTSTSLSRFPNGRLSCSFPCSVSQISSLSLLLCCQIPIGIEHNRIIASHSIMEFLL